MSKEELVQKQISIKLPVKEEEALPVTEVSRILDLDIRVSQSQLSTILTKLANRKKVRYNGKLLYVFWRNPKKEHAYKNIKFRTRDIWGIWEQRVLSVLPDKEEVAITGRETAKRIYGSYGIKRAIATIGTYLTGLCSSDKIKRKIENSGSEHSYVYWVADDGKPPKPSDISKCRLSKLSENLSKQANVRNKLGEGGNDNNHQQSRSKLSDSDSVRAFIKECVTLKPSERYAQPALWNEYKEYCDRFGLRMQQKSAFTAGIRACGVGLWKAKIDRRAQRVWFGLTFKGCEEETEKEVQRPTIEEIKRCECPEVSTKNLKPTECSIDSIKAVLLNTPDQWFSARQIMANLGYVKEARSYATFDTINKITAILRVHREIDRHPTPESSGQSHLLYHFSPEVSLPKPTSEIIDSENIEIMWKDSILDDHGVETGYVIPDEVKKLIRRSIIDKERIIASLTKTALSFEEVGAHTVHLVGVLHHPNDVECFNNPSPNGTIRTVTACIFCIKNPVIRLEAEMIFPSKHIHGTIGEINLAANVLDDGVKDTDERLKAIDDRLKRVNELHKVNGELREVFTVCKKRVEAQDKVIGSKVTEIERLYRQKEDVITKLEEEKISFGYEIEQLKKELKQKKGEIAELKQERRDSISTKAEEFVKQDIEASRKLLEKTFK